MRAQWAGGQRVGVSRSLVTYDGGDWGNASNTPDALGAIAAPAGCSPAHGSNRGSPVCASTAAGWPVYWPADTPGPNSTFGAPGSGDPEPRAFYSAGICRATTPAVWASKPVPIRQRRPPDKPEENPPRKKTDEEEKKRFLSEGGRKRTGGRRRFSNCRNHPIIRLPLSQSAHAQTAPAIMGGFVAELGA